MTTDNSNPRLNLKVDALLSKLYDMSFLQAPRFQMYVIDSLITKWFLNQPRELFEIMMKAEYKWRLALRAPYGEENAAMTNSVVGYTETADEELTLRPLNEAGNRETGINEAGGGISVNTVGVNTVGVNTAGGPVMYDEYQMEVATAQNYQDGWNEGRNALREEVLGDDAKRAMKQMMLDHSVRPDGSCACGRKYENQRQVAIHIALRIMNYFRNEFISQSGPSTGQ